MDRAAQTPQGTGPTLQSLLQQIKDLLDALRPPMPAQPAPVIVPQPNVPYQSGLLSPHFGWIGQLPPPTPAETLDQLMQRLKVSQPNVTSSTTLQLSSSASVTQRQPDEEPALTQYDWYYFNNILCRVDEEAFVHAYLIFHQATATKRKPKRRDQAGITHLVESRFKQLQTTFTCGVCFEQHYTNFAVSCVRFPGVAQPHEKHFFCRGCVLGYAKNAVEQASIARAGLGLKCMQPGCSTGVFFYAHVVPLLHGRSRELLEEKIADEALAAAGVNVERCQRCPFAAIVDIPIFLQQTFACIRCGFIYCRICKREWSVRHLGKTCQELNPEFIRRQVENMLSEGAVGVLQRCPNCHVAFEKNGGCNIMHCYCGYSFPYAGPRVMSQEQRIAIYQQQNAAAGGGGREGPSEVAVLSGEEKMHIILKDGEAEITTSMNEDSLRFENVLDLIDENDFVHASNLLPDACFSWLLDNFDRGLQYLIDHQPSATKRKPKRRDKTGVTHLVESRLKLQTTFTCVICFDDYRTHLAVSCVRAHGRGANDEGTHPHEQHHFCRGCVTRYAESAVEQGSIVRGGLGLKCMQSNCPSGLLIIAHVVPLLQGRSSAQLEEKIAAEAIAAAAVNVERCLRCPYGEIIDEPVSVKPTFACAKCGFEYCRTCKVEWSGRHFGKSCAQLDPEFIRRKAENELSDRAVNGLHHCPICNVAIEKNQGCNKVTCCGLKIPYKQPRQMTMDERAAIIDQNATAAGGGENGQRSQDPSVLEELNKIDLW